MRGFLVLGFVIVIICGAIALLGPPTSPLTPCVETTISGHAERTVDSIRLPSSQVLLYAAGEKAEKNGDDEEKKEEKKQEEEPAGIDRLWDVALYG